MYGINAGYDTRPMATGYADTGVSVFNQNTVFFQQAAVNLSCLEFQKHQCLCTAANRNQAVSNQQCLPSRRLEHLRV